MKKMNAILGEEEARLRVFLNSTVDLVFLKDRDFRHLMVNNRYIDFLGMERDLVLGKTDFELLPENLAEQCRRSDRKALQEGKMIVTFEKSRGRIYESRKFPVNLGEGAVGVGGFIRDITERKKAEEIISRLNRCFLSLGADSRENIRILVETAGDILGGACALYNRYEKERGLLCTWGIWQEPEGYQSEDSPEGHICYDVIKEGGGGPVIIEDLAGTGYEKTDPNVKKYGIKSYLGCPVRLKGEMVGSFCLCDVKPRRFTEKEIEIIGMLARAVAIEEARLWTGEAIERSKREWEETFDAVPDLIAILDQDYRIVRANRAMAERLGVPITELAGAICYRAVHETEEPPDFCPHARLLKDGREHTAEALLAPLGGDFLISASPIRNREGRLTGAVHVARDITGLKKTENELRESQRKYRSLFDSSMDAIMILAPPDWRFASGNPAAVNIFGARDEEEFTGIKPWEVSPEYQPDGRLSSEKAAEMISKAMEVGSNFFEWTHKRLSGEEFPSTVLLTRFILEDTHVLQATVRDVSERKRAEEELAKYRDKLEDMVKDRTTELQSLVGSMAGREARMADLKDVIKLLREQIKEAGMEPVADDPLLGGEES